MNRIIEHLYPWIAIFLLLLVAHCAEVKPATNKTAEPDPVITKLGDGCYRTILYASTDPFREVNCNQENNR